MARRVAANMRWVLSRFFEDELDELRTYVDTVEAALSKRFDDLEDEIDRRTQGMSQERKNDYAEMMADDAFQLTDRFPSMVRKTSFVFLYGLFEHTLLNLCGHVKRYGKFEQAATDGKDKGITAARLYLKNVAKVRFPDQSREWNEIKQMAELRNCFSHRQGQIKDKPSKALLAYIKKKKGLIEVTGMKEIKFMAGYCEDAIEVVRTLFAAIIKAVPDNLLRRSATEEIAETVVAMNALRASVQSTEATHANASK